MSKLHGYTKLTSEKNHKEKLVTGLIQKKKLAKIKSFRLGINDIQGLDNLRIDVNQISQTNISESKIIKALINIGIKLGPKKLLKSLSETIWKIDAK